jgi:hypothetical protein
MSNKAPSVIDDRLNLRMLTKPVTGPSGRYIYFLGQHWNGTFECYDVGSARMDRRPIEITRRHHKTKEEALITWETLNKRLKEIESEKYEKPDPLRIIH